MPQGNESHVTKDKNIDANMVVILGVLLFALLCALGLNSVVRCALRCANQQHHHYNRREGGPAYRSTIKQIPTTNYHVASTTASSGKTIRSNNNVIMSTDCMICLGEFMEGEKIKVLPKCKHGFHSKCIDTWLLSNSTCPTCRQSLLEWAGNGAIVVPIGFGNRTDFTHYNSSGGDATQRN
ncbi:RING-H2 finger protein ATL73 [Bienertia sinuspersici]